jgi:hypothetical protein
VWDRNESAQSSTLPSAGIPYGLDRQTTRKTFRG